MKKSTLKLTLTAIFAALGLITFVIEGLLPPLFLPGARLGLSNVFILLAVIFCGWQYGFCVLIVKTVLGSLFAGNISAVMYSLPSGALALTVEIVLLYFAKRISIVSISVAGGVISTVIQNTVFCLVNKTSAYLIYSPYLALIGALSGAVVGFTVYLICLKSPDFFVDKKSDTIKENEN